MRSSQEIRRYPHPANLLAQKVLPLPDIPIRASLSTVPILVIPLENGQKTARLNISFRPVPRKLSAHPAAVKFRKPGAYWRDSKCLPVPQDGCASLVQVIGYARLPLGTWRERNSGGP